MGIILNDGFRVNAPKPVDVRYLKNETTAWTSVSEVNTAIPTAYRHPGLTVLVGTSEYWYVGGIADVNLVKKSNTDIILNLTSDGFYQFTNEALVAALVVTPNADITFGLGATIAGDIIQDLTLGANITTPVTVQIWRNVGQRLYFSGLAGATTKIIIKTI